MTLSRRNIRIALTALSVTGLVAFLGNACSGFNGAAGGAGSLASNLTSPNSQASQCTGPTFQTVPGTITVSIEYGSEILSNMETCLNLAPTDLSAQTIADNNARMPAFSQAGYVGDMNSAMMMGIAAVAVDVCSDLAAKEAAEAVANRLAYPMVDFTQTTIPAAAVTDSATRLARMCWARNPTAAELNVISAGTTAMGAVGANFQSVNICASVLASLSGVMIQ